MEITKSSVLFYYAATLSLMALFPPFTYFYRGEIKLNLGYAFILTPPLNFDDMLGHIDIPVLITQVFLCSLVFGALYLAFSFSSKVKFI